jgi:hypothetical protein
MTTASSWNITHTVLCCPTARQLDRCWKCSVSAASVGYGDQANGAYKERSVHRCSIFIGTEYGTLNSRRIVASRGAGVMLVEQVLRCYMTLERVR